MRSKENASRRRFHLVAQGLVAKPKFPANHSNTVDAVDSLNHQFL